MMTAHKLTMLSLLTSHALGFLLALAFLCSGSHADSTNIRQPRYSAPEVRAIIAHALMQIQSIRIQYTAKANIKNEIGDYVAREVICMRPCLVYHQGAHGNHLIFWEDDLELQRAWIQKERYYNEYPWRRSYFFEDLKPNAPLPGTLQYDSWFQCSSWWPIDREPPLVWGVAPMLHEVAASHDYDHVRPQLDEVQGRWCHVLERRGVDALWIDCDRPPGLMQRIAWEPNTGRLIGQVELTHQQLVADDVWLPFRYRNRFYNTEFESHDKPSTDYTLLISEASVNEVDPTVFEFAPPEGTISYPAQYSERGEPNVASGGLEHLDHIISWIKRNHSLKQLNKRGWKSYLIFIVSSGLCAWILLHRILPT